MDPVFEINSKGLCLYCVQINRASRSSLEETSDSDSFHCFMRYLRMDILELCQVHPIFSTLQVANGPLSHLSIETISANKTLCSNCETNMNGFHKQYKIWSEAALKINTYLKNILCSMQMGNGSADRMEEYRKRVEAPISSDIRISKFTDNWRNNAFNKLGLRIPAVNASDDSAFGLPVPMDQVESTSPIPGTSTSTMDFGQISLGQLEDIKIECVDEAEETRSATVANVDLEMEPEKNLEDEKLFCDFPNANELSLSFSPCSQDTVTTCESNSNEAIETSPRLRRSTRVKTSKKVLPFKCDVCSGWYDSKELLAKHVKDKHVHCSYCVSIHSTASSLERHNIKDHTMNYVKDQLQRDVSSEQLNRFVDTTICKKNAKGQIDQYQCPHCEKHYKVLGFYKYHIFKTHLNHIEFG